ncbi:MAG: hypothetical protein M3R30_09175 [Candidatus Eremiobacteraeota bacterium]|nr:hypothetical protein [Candidatus Eremiobacteraeota bacterium]
MRAEHLAHVLRAAAEITGQRDFVVIGSQAILGAHPELCEGVLVRSIEVDLYPRDVPALSDMLAEIGEFSDFHSENGYYADAVDPGTAILPVGWETRTVRFDAGKSVVGHCLDPHDLIIAKLVATRDKDIAYFEEAAARGLVARLTLSQRLRATSISSRAKRKLIASLIGTAY